MSFNEFIRMMKEYVVYLYPLQPYLPAIATVGVILLMDYVYVKRFMLRRVFVDLVVFGVLVLVVSFAGLSWVSFAATFANNDTAASLETLVIAAASLLSIVANFGWSLWYHDPKFRQ